MHADTLHVIIRDTRDGFFATSPQGAGLAYGRPTLEELHADLDDVLRFHFEEAGPFTVVEHHERHYDIADRELVTRIAIDEQRDERQDVYTRIGHALTIPDQARSLVEGPTNGIGEVVFVCAVPSDTVGWLAGQTDRPGDAVVVAVAVGDELVLTMPFNYSEEYAHRAQIPVGHVGLDAETTIGDIMKRTPIVQPVQSRRLLVG